ncbi:bh protein [Planococcus sp. CP5-4]|uniref:bh protein n=1 Tax=unclassified Planococcus (in: firmicutes) TaxID=2662419 RepID=UPI001C2403A7|nr:MULTISPECIES: bh protein [unclassified Planococcus (in: firmicutes)]MBU9672706.1 bh protein [Planococcus sp. CP5-4_YE]MBV0908480.1 bh protein [Planococcus sp. CP5-4_UN]MBW6063247.1 bh protein [Planococcus sp. CP5-4]MDN5709396.1 bh protein [Planococcus sp. (in: firmicutes)]
MKVKKMEAGLYCVHCREDVNHEITYINDDIKRIRCMQCNRTIEMNMDLKKEFYKELYERISTKPTRVTKEYREDLSHLLLSLPFRAIKKPYRVLKEVHSSRRVINTYKPKNK